MKRHSIFVLAMVFALAAGRSFAASYQAGAATMSLDINECETRTVSVDGSTFGTSPLVSGGFLITLADMTKVAITACQCYDGTLTPAVWDEGIVPVGVCDGCNGTDPLGYPGGLFVAAANLGAGVTPSANILVCDVTFCGIEAGSSALTIDTVPDFDTWVAQDSTVHDPTIDPAFINVNVSGGPVSSTTTVPDSSTTSTTSTTPPITTTTSTISPVTLQLTPDSWYQSRWVSLIKYLRIEGSDSHFDRSVTEVTFTPQRAAIMLPLVIDESTINCIGILMPRWWAPVDALDITVTTGAEVATATMEIKLLPFLLDQEKQLLQEE
jgi:hypothetical protein